MTIPFKAFLPQFGLLHSVGARAWISAVLTILATLSAHGLGTFRPIFAGLDPSWVAALGEAASRGDVFGRDLIYTGGPLNAFYTRYFDPVLWPVVLAEDALVAGALAWSCGRLASDWFVALLLPFSIFVASSPDATLFALPALAGLAVLQRPGAPYGLIVLAAVAAALLILAKFSTAPIAVTAFIAIDMAMIIRERRPPIALAVFAVALVGGFAALEGSAAYFIDFIRYSVETSAGYVAAMSIDGNLSDLAGFLVLATALGFMLCVRAYRSAVSGSFLTPLLVTLVFGILCFIGFKAGFIRHDQHRLIAFGVLTLAFAGYAAFEERRMTRWLVIALCVTSAAISLCLTSPKVLVVLQNHVSKIGYGLKNLSELTLHPDGWLRDQRAAMESGRATVRAATPLPAIKGSIDVLPPMQSALIAAGLNYRPRFTVQDFTSYTPLLIGKNHESWFGLRAPAHILFGLEPTDDRYPALSEGPLWPDLLRYYEPTQRLSNLALLSRRAHPLPDLLGPSETRHVRIGEPFEINEEPTFLQLDIRYSWLGHLLSILLKPPEVRLRLVNGIGTQKIYRIIPGIARAGFVITPEVVTSDDFLVLALGEQPALNPSARPKFASVEVSNLASWAYAHDVSLTLRTIDVSSLKSRPAAIDVQNLLREMAARRRLLDAVSADPPTLVFIAEGLLAHAPRRIIIPVVKARSVTVTFGIRDGAWNPGQTEGGCFSALTEAGAMLWQRCLDPLRQMADRGLQTAHFDLPTEQPRIILETLCRSRCNWAWTYWRGIEIDPPL